MKVSVIIPTHNSEKTLERTLQSVLNQDADCDVEILLCDDHSHDLGWLLKIADQYDCKLLRVAGKGGGPNFGRNMGIMNATGDVIAFLDHDDEWLPGKLKNQLKEITNGAEFVYSSGITQKV
jgi:glycosyltransferase involved in cell wall biosynthesis